MSYDALVRMLRRQIADGVTTVSLVREAIDVAAELGRLPADLSGILISLFPAAPAHSPTPTDISVEQTADAGEDFDEPTLPYVLAVRPEVSADTIELRAHSIEQAALEIEGHETVEELTSEPRPPTREPSDATVAGLAGNLRTASAAGLPPLPALADRPPAAASFTPATPVQPNATLPAHDDIQAKVDDVVLSALIGEFQNMRRLRENAGPERSSGKPDGLDGLLVNYRSARFRSDARKAARGATSEGLRLGKLDDFGSKRAGVGSILRDRFILDAEIGRGGMGIVYSAVDRRRLEAGNGQPYVALKLLNDEFRSNSDALRVLEAEARKAQSLAHPNIATVYDFDRDRSEIFIVMELLTGKPLSRVLGASVGQAMPGHRIAAILKSVCAGLAYAHRQGVVHSDLKPGNVFVADDDTVKLLDFGLATAGPAGGFDVTTLNGLTAAYASPEMFDNAPRDPRDDIFALGCIAYQLLTGMHPFSMKASSEAAAEKLEPEPIPDIDPAAWTAIRQALSFDRETRIASVEQFVAGLFEA